MKHIAILVFLLAVFWLINSGHFTPLLLALGAASVALVTIVTWRKRTLDGEYQPPVLLSPRMPAYLFWLGIEIFKSNLDVIRRVWQGRPDISPTVVSVPAPQDALLRTLYANSITMTPGTVTLETGDDGLTVHALTREGAESLRTGEMERQVSRLQA